MNDNDSKKTCSIMKIKKIALFFLALISVGNILNYYCFDGDGIGTILNLLGLFLIFISTSLYKVKGAN